VTKKERYQTVLDYFRKNAPQAETELHYGNDYQLLVAVILSAQCTDVRVNFTTPALFKAYPSLQKLSQATPYEVFPFIKSISYPNNKAKHLVNMANMVMQDFNGKIPMQVHELVKLPGVGRKTANVVTSVLDNQPNMAVDTHVYRVSQRLGLTKAKVTVLAAEKELIKFIPSEDVHIAHHWLILHGRYVCKAKNPACQNCHFNDFCLFFKKTNNILTK
jgi:endonuclease III